MIMLGFFISGYVFSAVLVLLGLSWLDYIGIQTAVPDLNTLECFGSSVLTPGSEFCRKSHFFLTIPCAPGGAITLQGL